MNLLKVMYSGVFVLGLALILLSSPVSAQAVVTENNTTTGNQSTVGVCVIGVDSPCNSEEYESPTRPAEEENEPHYRNNSSGLPVDSPDECVPGPATMCDHHLKNQPTDANDAGAVVDPISTEVDTEPSVFTRITEFVRTLFSQLV